MDFEVNNRYWISCFIKDFMDKENVYMKHHKIEMFGIETAEKKLKYRNRSLLNSFLSKYARISTNFILSIPISEKKTIFTYRFHSFLHECDEDKSLNLTLLKFDLVQLPFQSMPKYYLFVCKIDSRIDFELLYGTLKILNKI